MTIDFTIKDVFHKTIVKFVKAFLPTAKKAFHLKAVNQQELDIHDIASKAAVYNIGTSPKVIEEGLNAGIELIYYLVADGFRIKTPLFNLKMRIPGEYSGKETSLPDGVYPVARLQTSSTFRKYLREKVSVEFDGFDSNNGIIAEITDDATGRVDEVITIGNIITIHGDGIKVDGDEENKNKIGVYFRSKSGAVTKAQVIAVNEPRTLKILVPQGLKKGAEYYVSIETQTTAKRTAHILKDVRSVCSDFTVIAA